MYVFVVAEAGSASSFPFSLTQCISSCIITLSVVVIVIVIVIVIVVLVLVVVAVAVVYSCCFL